MRAAVLAEVGGGLALRDLAEPVPLIGEVLLEVAACGVCHTDLHVMKGEVGFPLPAVLGHEVCGTVSAVGPGVTQVAVGDRVVASFIMPCGTCAHCVRGEDDLCSTFFSMNRLHGTLYDGTSRLATPAGEVISMYSMGGLAERCVVPATDVFAIPASLSLSDVATVGCSVLTAYGAVKNVGKIKLGDDVAVVAVGGVGSAIIQVARAFGARRIIAIDIDERKLAAALDLGATHAILSGASTTEEVLSLTEGRGVDVAFEALGGAATFATAASVVTDGGAVVVVGIAPAGVVGAIDLARMARRKLRILGSYGGRVRTDLPEIIELVERGVLTPRDLVTRHFSLDQADEAYQALARGEIVGRAVIEMADHVN